MIKSLIAAAILSLALGIADANASEAGITDVKFSFDADAPISATYEQIQRKAKRVCDKDAACATALTNDLVKAVGNAELAELHFKKTGENPTFQVASTERG